MSEPQPVSVAVVGAGSRGTAYAEWVGANPRLARIVAVAEPRETRRSAFAARHGLPPERVFARWDDLVAATRTHGRLADIAAVTTLDDQHVEPALALADLGYHLLLEKPIAPTAAECRRVVAGIQDAGVMLAVCHVLRYASYTDVVKRVVDSGRLGRVLDVQHLEPVGFWHQAHSYVRGNWRREDTTSPMLLAKCCHDVDWLRYIVGRPIERVSSFGSLSHFRAEERPAGAGERCTDCRVEPCCPYSAVRFYGGLAAAGRTGWPLDVITEDLSAVGVRRVLETGPYGRCVYACDNDVVDHQVVALEFGGGATATLTMTAFAPAGHRRTRIHGSHGSLECDGDTVSVTDFLTAETETIEVATAGMDAGAGHGGGDAGVIAALVAAVASGDPGRIRSGPAESLETHLAVFAAETARHRGTVEPVGTPAPVATSSMTR